jgi:hypothetical protein
LLFIRNFAIKIIKIRNNQN